MEFVVMSKCQSAWYHLRSIAETGRFLHVENATNAYSGYCDILIRLCNFYP